MTEKHNLGMQYTAIFRQGEQFFNVKAAPHGAWFKHMRVERFPELGSGANEITLTVSSYVTDDQSSESSVEDTEVKLVIQDEEWTNLGHVQIQFTRALTALLREVGALPEYEDLPVTRAELEHHISGPHHNSGSEQSDE